MNRGAPSVSLPAAVREALEPLFAALPPDQAMARLVPEGPASPEVLEAVRTAIATSSIAENPYLQAGLWLYADELDASHRISQSLPDAAGAYWHAIMHRREGDFGNSKYWVRSAGLLPAEVGFGFDPIDFVDEVARRHRDDPEDLVLRQREEWTAFFAWCAERFARTKT